MGPDSKAALQKPPPTKTQRRKNPSERLRAARPEQRGPAARTLAVPPRRVNNRDPDQGADVCSPGSRSGGAGNDGEAELLTLCCIFGWFLTGEDREDPTQRDRGTATGSP